MGYNGLVVALRDKPVAEWTADDWKTVHLRDPLQFNRRTTLKTLPTVRRDLAYMREGETGTYLYDNGWAAILYRDGSALRIRKPGNVKVDVFKAALDGLGLKALR